MRIASSKTREQFPLSKKKILKKTIASNSGMVFVTLLIFIFYLIATSADLTFTKFFLSISTILTLLLLLLFLTIIHTVTTYLYQYWYWAVYFYDLTNDYIVIKKGPITPREITIPYERIQDVYVDQDLWDRIFGLYDVHLSSATVTSGVEAHIDGLEKEAADGIRAILLNVVKERISKNKGQTTSQTGAV